MNKLHKAESGQLRQIFWMRDTLRYALLMCALHLHETRTMH